MPTLEDQIRAAFERVAARTLVNPAPSCKVLDRTPVRPSEEEPHMIDLETPSHTDEHQKRTKRVLVAGLLAAAAVVAIALVSIRNDDPANPADQPSLSVTAPVTSSPANQPSPTVTVPVNATDPPAPTVTVAVQDAMVTRSVDPDGDGATPLRVTYQVPTDGWKGNWFGAVKYLPGDADGITALSITTVSNLVADGCRDHTPLDPPVGPTVDDLVIALSQLAPFEVTAPPTDVALFGYQGKHLELTVPALPVAGAGNASAAKNLAKFTGCVEGELYSWISPINDRSSGLLGHSPDSLGAFNAYQAPGQTEEFWILDVGGTRVVLVKFDTPGAPSADIAERDAIFESIRIEP